MLYCIIHSIANIQIKIEITNLYTFFLHFPILKHKKGTNLDSLFHPTCNNTLRTILRSDVTPS